MNLWQEYKRPATIAEAIHELTSASGSVMPIAGGTDLLIDLKQGRQVPVHTLIDLTFIPELNAIELKGEELYIGAAVPANRMALNPLVTTHAQALAEASSLIAGLQIRNVATLGGNVAHALPAADGTIALTALDAQAQVAGVAGMHRMPFTSLFISPGKSAINKSAEIIVGFYIPTHQTQKVLSKHTRNETLEAEINRVSSCFKRIMRPQGVALPILNCAIWLKRENDIIKDIHIAVGPGGPKPFRATEVERVMKGQPLNEKTISDAIELLLAQVQFRTSARRASVDYRRHIVGGLFTDVLKSAWQRAK